jgi:hypothetical protein
MTSSISLARINWTMVSAFWICFTLLVAFSSETSMATGFVVNNSAPQTGAVVGRASGSPDVVTASGTFAGSYSQNIANGGATELVTINSNAVITPPNANGVANYWVQNIGNPAYTNYFNGLIEINQGEFTNFGSINTTFSSLPASGSLFALDTGVDNGEPSPSGNYYYGLGVLAWNSNVSGNGTTTINNYSGGTISGTVTGSGNALAAGVYSFQNGGSSSGVNLTVNNYGTISGSVASSLNGTACGVYNMVQYNGGCTVNNYSGAMCTATATFYTTAIFNQCFGGPATVLNQGTVQATASGSSSNRATACGMDVFGYGTGANINVENDGSLTATTTGGNNWQFAIPATIYTTQGTMTFKNTGTITGTSTSAAQAGEQSVYCGGSGGDDYFSNTGTITGTAGGRGGWAVGVENDGTNENIHIFNSGTISHNNGFGLVVFGTSNPGGTLYVTNTAGGSISGASPYGIGFGSWNGPAIFYDAGNLSGGVTFGSNNDTMYVTGLPTISGTMNGGGGTNALVLQLNGALERVNGQLPTQGTNLAAYSLGTSGYIVVSGQAYSWQNFNVSGTVTNVDTNAPLNGLYSWSAPVSINGLTAGQILTNVPGTYFEAEAFGGEASSQVVQIGSTAYTFKVDGSSASISGGLGTAAGSFSGNTGNSTLNTVLNDFYWDGGRHQITLHNLVPGQVYSAQLFALDDRSPENTRQSSFQDPNNAADVSATFLMGQNDYVLATFIATNANMTIQQNLDPSSGAGNTEAVVVRVLTSVPPPTIGFSGTNLQVSWPYGTLLQTTNLAGPWTTNSAASPYTIVPNTPQMFFRTQLP